MQRRHPRATVLQAATGLAVAGVLSTVGLAPSAIAAEPTDTNWQNVNVAAKSPAAARAEIARIQSQIGALQAQADKAGRAAQVADERYLKAKAASDAAVDQDRRAQAAADAAASTARASRARAGALNAYLARSGSDDQTTTSLILGGSGATRTLYGLSRLSQFGVEAGRASRKAAADSATAARLESVAAAAARDTKARSDSAKAAYLGAKKQSDAAAAKARWQVTRQSVLTAQLTALGDTTVKASSSVGAATVALPPNASKAARAVAFARAQIGDPYVFGAAGPSSWDCSGLTMGAYASVGINIGIHSATAQYNLARAEGKLVPYGAAQPGDLIFYTDGGGDMYHTAIYSGNGDMIEAPYEGRPVREVPVRSYQLLSVVARPSA